MLDLWWAAPLTDEHAKNVLSSFNPNADALDISSNLERCKKEASRLGVCLNEFFLRNGAQAATDARAAWSEVVSRDSCADPNVNYELDTKSFDLLSSDLRAACLKQLFSYARMMHGSGRVLRIAAAVPAG